MTVRLPRPRFQLRPDTAEIIARANAAAAAWDDAAILPFLRQAIHDQPEDSRRWHMLGLAQRNLDQHEDALRSFREATRLSPNDPLTAHALARTSLEAGLPATSSFDRALMLAPLDASVILGRTAAKFAEEGAAPAVDDLRAHLDRHPAWYEGHATAARLLWLAGAGVASGETFEKSLITRPQDGVLWREYAMTSLRSGNYSHVSEIVKRARGAVGKSRTLDLIEAASASESGNFSGAESLFAPDASVGDEFLVYQIRHHLRSGRPDVVRAILDGRGVENLPPDLISLVMLAWRELGDSRFDELVRGKDLIRVFDLAESFGSLDALADILRGIHLANRAPLDQSVRAGTQTDGPLFSRIDPAIRQLREIILGAVSRYVADLPPPKVGHPLLGQRRTPLRFAGSWSVRLADNGHHVDHVHPAGWISSAFYVAVPDALDDSRSGWLALGDAPSLGLSFPPILEIEPKPGRLVLFPSFLWHRTLPFPKGERLTVAFDMARPPR